jgi:hypothetical protein
LKDSKGKRVENKKAKKLKKIDFFSRSSAGTIF